MQNWGGEKLDMKQFFKYLLFTEGLSFFPFLFLRIQLQLEANSSDTNNFFSKVVLCGPTQVSSLLQTSQFSADIFTVF